MLASRGPGVRVNILGVPQSPPHSRNESVRLWRLLEGPVSASLPNSWGKPREVRGDLPRRGGALADRADQAVYIDAVLALGGPAAWARTTG